MFNDFEDHYMDGILNKARAMGLEGLESENVPIEAIEILVALEEFLMEEGPVRTETAVVSLDRIRIFLEMAVEKANHDVAMRLTGVQIRAQQLAAEFQSGEAGNLTREGIIERLFTIDDLGVGQMAGSLLSFLLLGYGMQSVLARDLGDRLHRTMSSKPAQGYESNKVAHNHNNLKRIPGALDAVFLTFDADICDVPGAIGGAEGLLDYLKNRNIKTTFFLTGRFVETHPALTLRILEDGHEIGSHLYSHANPIDFKKNNIEWSREFFMKELLSTDLAIRKISGGQQRAVRFFRMPYGITQYLVIPGATQDIQKWGREAGYRHFDWSADTQDWVTHEAITKAKKEHRLIPPYATGKIISKRILDAVDQNKGTMVLSHLVKFRSKDDDAPIGFVPLILEGVQKRGLHVARISDYMEELPAVDGH